MSNDTQYESVSFPKLRKELDSLLGKTEDETVENIITREVSSLARRYRETITYTKGSPYTHDAYPNASVLAKILEMIDEITVEINAYTKNLRNTISLPASSTYEAILTRFKTYDPSVEHLAIEENVENTPGTVRFWIIKKLAEDPTPPVVQDERLWNAIHKLKPVGIVTRGGMVVHGEASNKQPISYRYDLGSRQYVYVKVDYYLNDEKRNVLNIRSRVKAIYRDVVKRNYGTMGRSLDYQDFVTPVMEIDGIAGLDFSYQLSALTAKDIDINALAPNSWIKNKDYDTAPRELLMFNFDEGNEKYMIIDVKAKRDRNRA